MLQGVYFAGRAQTAATYVDRPVDPAVAPNLAAAGSVLPKVMLRLFGSPELMQFSLHSSCTYLAHCFKKPNCNLK